MVHCAENQSFLTIELRYGMLFYRFPGFFRSAYSEHIVARMRTFFKPNAPKALQSFPPDSKLGGICCVQLPRNPWIVNHTSRVCCSTANLRNEAVINEYVSGAARLKKHQMNSSTRP